MPLRALYRSLWISALLTCSAQAQLPFPPTNQWVDNGPAIWTSIQTGRLTAVTGTDGVSRPVRIIGHADLMVSATPANLEIDAQFNGDFRDSAGTLIRFDSRKQNDPVSGLNVSQTGGTFIKLPAPFDHDQSGKPLGLRVSEPNATLARGGAYNRLGIRFKNTPPGRLLFLYEMSTPAEEGTRWYAREFTAPLPGLPWRPTRAMLERDHPEVHLRKLAVIQLEPWSDPAERIPAKLNRADLRIDLDASALGMDWDALKKWIETNINDTSIPAGKTFVIQLPAGHLVDADSLGINANKHRGWGRAVHSLTEGRKVWLIGHPDTTVAAFHSISDNLGLLFCRIARPVHASATDAAAAYEYTASLDGKNIDFRNNWIDCPDALAMAGIIIRGAENATILDNIISGTGAGIGTHGPSSLTHVVIARNWIERGHDAFQMYGSWVDVIIAYNHMAGASGFANRITAPDRPGALGGNYHSDEFQSQANQTSRHPQSILLFGNFSQFGRHNWPAQWAEIGGGTQNIIIDGDSYARSHIYWNIFQNLMPSGHRGIKTISPDLDWVRENPAQVQRNYIENFSIIGNAFLERWDHNNTPAYGYFPEGSGIGGPLGASFFQLIATENAYTRTHLNREVSLFKQTIESRPDASLREGWRADVPTLTDVYQKPITFTGTWQTGYQADFSRTTYSGNKLLEGFVEPTDYAPKPGWEKSPGGAAMLTPASELAKIAPMPVDLAKFLGDPSRKGSLFDELRAAPVQAKPLVLDSPWRNGSPDDGFLLHAKFRSVGTKGTLREIFSETQGDKRHEVVLTENDTVRYRLLQGGEVISQVETTDRFRDSDHLTMQIYTPYFPVAVESYYPLLMLRHAYDAGIRRIRYLSADTPPPASSLEQTPGVLHVWMNPSDHYRFSEWTDGAWRPVRGARDAIHTCALRSFSDNRDARAPGTGTSENFWRDRFPIPQGTWFTINLNGPGEEPVALKDKELGWSFTKENAVPAMNLQLAGKPVGVSRFFVGNLASGRVRGIIRRNIDHQDKKWDWLWTPDVALPRGQVSLFRTFDGSYESFRIIRGGQGEYGLPPNPPAYRSLETVAPALTFIREPVDASGKVPGWGTPDIYLKAP